MIVKGRIIYADGGLFEVKVLNNKTLKSSYFAKPIGRLKQEIIPKIGDIVDLQINEQLNRENVNTIIKVHKRKNFFYRPIIANLDSAIIVSSLKGPDFDFFLLLKLIASFQVQSIEPIIVFTKYDLLNKKQKQQMKPYFIMFKQLGYRFLIVEFDHLNLKDFKKFLKDDKFLVITGQSGAGKSTFLNHLNPKYQIKTNEISKTLNRGKHTTRNYKAYLFFDDVYIVDTPGFSSFELNEVNKEVLSWNFLDFAKLKGECKFSDCKHLNEPECKVQQIYLQDPIKKQAYEIYKKIMINI